MSLLTSILILAIIAFHFYAFVLEVFFWQKPLGLKTFGLTAAAAASSHTLAINQGIYNLFLVAGFIWSLLVSDPLASQLQIFFLGCVLAAAITAGLVSSKRIMLLQGVPALVTLLLVLFT